MMTSSGKRRTVDDEDVGAVKELLAGKKVSERRRGQNRAAQRHFREKKEKHMSTLEDRVGDLEKDLSVRVSENDALKQLLLRMREENVRLKGETASSQPTQSAVTGDDGQHDDVSLHQPFDFTFSSTQSNFGPVLSYPISNGNFPSSLPTPPDSTTSYTSHTSSPAVTPTDFDYSFLADPYAAPGQASHNFFDAGFSPLSSAAGEDESSASSSRLPSTPPSFGTDYRDVVNLASFDFGDSILSTATTTTTELDEFDATFLPQPARQQDAVLPAAVSTAQVNCYELPYKFDIDGLCSDMKMKATCQEAARAALAAAISEDAALISQSTALGS